MFGRRRIVIMAGLAALAVVLSFTRVRVLDAPNGIGNMTIGVLAMIGGIVAGPLVGLLIGAIFGIYSWLASTSPLFSNPLVSVLPRLLIGVTAAFTYKALRKHNEYLALIMAGVVGTLTNTILVLGMAVILNLLPVAAIPSIIPQAIAEIVIAVIITVAVIVAWKRMDKGAGKSSV